MKKTKYPATHIVHCPSGPTNACEDHARQIKGLMNFMGAHVGITACPDGVECDNCVNENKKRPAAIGESCE